METGGFRFLADSAPPVRRFSACPFFTALFRAPRSKNTTENHTPPRRRKRPPFDRAPRLSIRQAVANIEHAAPPDSGKPSAVRPRRRKRPPWRPCAASGLSAIPATSELRHHRQAVATVCRVPRPACQRFDRAAGFRPVSGSTAPPDSPPSNAAPDSPASPAPIPATVRAVRSRSIASRARFRFAARPPPSPETRRKRPPLRPPAPDGFAPVTPCRALASLFQAV